MEDEMHHLKMFVEVRNIELSVIFLVAHLSRIVLYMTRSR
jgi:hypothetical protein